MAAAARLPAGPTTTAGILRDRAAAVSADRRERRAPPACARGGGRRKPRPPIFLWGPARVPRGKARRGGGAGGGGAGPGWSVFGLFWGLPPASTGGVRRWR